MKILIAPDKFRGCLTAIEASQAMARGVRAGWAEAEVDVVPMADGGEGTVEALVTATSGTYHEAAVTGPLGERVRARYGLLGGKGETAVIEMAAASGLWRVPADQRDPSLTSTRGTGELILAAIAAGARSIVLGIGGSATNDGGAGLAKALGYRLLDADGQMIGPGGGPLERLERIDPSGRDPRLDGVTICVACDVDNPLCGPNGASAVYGPQKGATPAMVERLDRGLGRLAAILRRDLGVDVSELPGAGAAGGLGAGLVAFAGGTLRSGTSLVINAIGLESRMDDVGLCLTGEGAIDGSSAAGKVVVGVSRLARSKGVPVVALAGTIGEGARAVLEEGVSAYFALAPRPMSLEESLSSAAENLERAAEQVVRTFRAGIGR
jgi:glycerate kinase